MYFSIFIFFFFFYFCYLSNNVLFYTIHTHTYCKHSWPSDANFSHRVHTTAIINIQRIYIKIPIDFTLVAVLRLSDTIGLDIRKWIKHKRARHCVVRSDDRLRPRLSAPIYKGKTDDSNDNNHIIFIAIACTRIKPEKQKSKKKTFRIKYHPGERKILCDIRRANPITTRFDFGGFSRGLFCRFLVELRSCAVTLYGNRERFFSFFFLLVLRRPGGVFSLSG